MENDRYKDMKAIDRLVVFLDSRKIKQRDFAQVINVKPNYIPLCRKNRNGVISSTVLQRIFKAYPDLNMMWLICGEGNMLGK